MTQTLKPPYLWLIRGAIAADFTHAEPGSLMRRAIDVASPEGLLWVETAQKDAPALSGASETSTFTLARDVGDAAGAPSFIYMVQTDIPADVVEEYTRWYDEEHLPRLVRVPGILRARRYEAVKAQPFYLTAYDLCDVNAFESPQGLVARKTPWTERMRSKFFNARRSTWRLT